MTEPYQCPSIYDDGQLLNCECGQCQAVIDAVQGQMEDSIDQYHAYMDTVIVDINNANYEAVIAES